VTRTAGLETSVPAQRAPGLCAPVASDILGPEERKTGPLRFPKQLAEKGGQNREQTGLFSREQAGSCSVVNHLHGKLEFKLNSTEPVF